MASRRTSLDIAVVGCGVAGMAAALAGLKTGVFASLDPALRELGAEAPSLVLRDADG
jgi:hypothetical protein